MPHALFFLFLLPYIDTGVSSFLYPYIIIRCILLPPLFLPFLPSFFLSTFAKTLPFLLNYPPQSLAGCFFCATFALDFALFGRFRAYRSLAFLHRERQVVHDGAAPFPPFGPVPFGSGAAAQGSGSLPPFFFAWVWCSVMPRILDSRPDRTGVPPHSLLVCVLAAWILFFTMESLILAQDERWLQA